MKKKNDNNNFKDYDNKESIQFKNQINKKINSKKLLQKNSQSKDKILLKDIPKHDSIPKLILQNKTKSSDNLYTRTSKLSNRSSSPLVQAFVSINNESSKSLTKNHLSFKNFRINEDTELKQQNNKQYYKTTFDDQYHSSSPSKRNSKNSLTLKQIEHKKLSNRIFFIEQKSSQMRAHLIQQRQLRQKIIRQQQALRRKKAQQRLGLKPVFLNLPKQSTQSILQQVQSSIIKDTVVQMPEPKGIHHMTINPYSPRSTIYYISEIVKAYKDSKSLAREHIVQSLQILRTLDGSKMPFIEEIIQKKLNLPIQKDKIGKKVIIFDLDETLIHCNDSLAKKYDIKIGIKFSTGQIIDAGVNIRPYARQILKNLANHFQIFIFTASQSCYADEVLNILDPQNLYISHRLYREHCFLSPEGMYIKDLRIINRPLSDVVLVDNAAYSYFFQLQNGIPIIPYYHGSIDYQLKALQKYLLGLALQKDVRKINRSTFQLHRYFEYYNMPSKLVEDLYINDTNRSKE